MERSVQKILPFLRAMKQHYIFRHRGLTCLICHQKTLSVDEGVTDGVRDGSSRQ